MQFVRAGWSNLSELPRPSLQKVEYWVRQGRLERRSYPQVDGASGEQPALLLDRIEEIVWRFRDTQGDWREEWTRSQPDLLHRAVEMRVPSTGEPSVTWRFLVGPGPNDKTSVVKGKRVSERVYDGGARNL